MYVELLLNEASKYVFIVGICARRGCGADVGGGSCLAFSGYPLYLDRSPLAPTSPPPPRHHGIDVHVARVVSPCPPSINVQVHVLTMNTGPVHARRSDTTTRACYDLVRSPLAWPHSRQREYKASIPSRMYLVVCTLPPLHESCSQV